MKTTYKLLLLILLGVFFNSCANDDDDIRQQQIVQEGQVSYDGLSIPLTYADLYLVNTYQEGEVWALILSENFISAGTTYTDAYIYIEFFKENNSPLDGIYSTQNPYRTLDYAVYFEDVRAVNGTPQDYNLYIPNNSFNSGTLYVQRIANNAYDFNLQLITDDGLPLDAYFTGYLRQ